MQTKMPSDQINTNTDININIHMEHQKPTLDAEMQYTYAGCNMQIKRNRQGVSGNKK